MKAAVFKEVGQPLSIETVADPVPAASELVMKVAYCGICGTDLHATREGLTTACCGQILGHEFVGEIAEVGREAVGDWKVGDRVCALPFIGCGKCVACATGQFFQCTNKKVSGVDDQGGFADYVTSGCRETILLPDELDLETAALVEPLAVSLHAVRVAGLKAGQRVLVMGAGPIGLTVALWAKFFGARDVVVSELADTRAALARKMGATHVIKPDLTAGSAGLLEQFSDLTGGAPDIIFECVGAPGLLQQCMEIAPYGGKIIPVGVCEQPDSVMPFLGLIKELNVQFAIAYTKDDFETSIAMLAEKRIDISPMITDVIALDDLPGVFEALRTPSHQCKVLAKID
ncbi:zinc-binding dehydrogenase [Biformimicrobium ophioploci]|uniref:Alcohol dehydrogenase catalytic domain-containing protein n=1 Tax=Biformimicrobium ophioploci TaxID=3036711 RepID=A0ABQ6M1Y2_9GAMM|nr:alcohol dehydrogenase catalytic domain-containing protein [Microbulbifer sp. NKW57]GMG88364.1 alcohol dehydrogenase catalytic domain-containing protein [Microbulbifer sp. NKW57]